MKSRWTATAKRPLWLALALLGLVLALLAVRQFATRNPPLATSTPGAVRTPEITFDAIAPLSAADAAKPAELSIPAIAMNVNVDPMGWRIQIIDDKRTTAWALPQAAAGWHLNSAKPGMAGNVVISGHQFLGAAVFAPIALGDIRPGQDILLTDAKDRIFVYRILEVTDPIEISADPISEQQTAATYLSQTDAARLTLISGWPDFSSTHRVFVIAELKGRLNNS